MGTKKTKSIDKKANSTAEINRRMDALEKPIEVTGEIDFMILLLEGKSPQYYKRFSAWCRNTLDSPYYEDMQKAFLSMYALSILKGSSELTNDFVRGQANHVLKQGEEMRRLSEVSAFNKKEK